MQEKILSPIRHLAATCMLNC